MTPQERLALALQYQKQRDLGSALPSTPAENAARPVQEPEQSWLDKLNEVASGVGYGGQNLVEGMGQMARHPLDTLHSLAVGVGRAMDNPSAAAQATLGNVKQYVENAVSSPFNLGQAIGENINPRKLAAMLESPAVREIVAYHGTPHRFPATEANPLGEFDASKIGTGEGAQAYGKGIYLTEDMDFAKGYKPRDPKAEEQMLQMYNKAQDRHDYNSMEVLEAAMLHRTADELREQFPRQKSLVNRIAKINEKSPSSLYAADLPDEMIDRMLDYNKPINEHNKNVLDALEKAGINTQSTALAGQMIEGQEAHLAKFGIPGMIYREGRGKGPRNFVVFPGEEKKVKILERK